MTQQPFEGVITYTIPGPNATTDTPIPSLWDTFKRSFPVDRQERCRGCAHPFFNHYKTLDGTVYGCLAQITDESAAQCACAGFLVRWEG